MPSIDGINYTPNTDNDTNSETKIYVMANNGAWAKSNYFNIVVNAICRTPTALTPSITLEYKT